MGVAAVSPNTNAYTQILDLHRKNSRWLGALPYAAFERYADEGTLLGFVDDHQVLGYALYRLPSNQIGLTHLCVDSAARGQGVARALVEEIVHRHPDRTGIRLRCRRDYPAADLWPRLDFEPQGDVVGHSHAGDLLTQWWRDFGHPTLFNQGTTDDRVRVALDTDVFVDLSDPRPAGTASREMLAATWVSDVFELTITKELTQELNHQPDDAVRRRNIAFAESFGRAAAAPAQWKALERSLLAALAGRSLTDHDECDVRHLARAAAGGARYFVSRDRPQRKLLSDHARELLNIEIVTPAELVQLAHQEVFSDYDYRSIQGTRFHVRRLAANEVELAVAQFVNTADGERAGELRTTLQAVLSKPAEWRVEVVEADTALAALVAHRDHDDHREVALLRLHSPGDLTLARQVAFQVKDGARRSNLRGATVSDRCVSRAVQDALRSEAFVLDTTGWVAATIDLIGSGADLRRGLGPVPIWFQPKRDWSSLRGALSGPMPGSVVAEVEQRLWPLKVADGDLPTYLVPIAPAFAEDLFDVDLKAQTLFQRTDTLGMSREHVYYRSPLPNRPESGPARILWYVTQGSGRPGTGAVRACSLLLEVVVESPDRLHRRFGRYGVWRRDDVRRVARDGSAMALRFTNTELFDRPVTRGELQEGSRELGCQRPFLQSPWLMPSELFEWIYRKGRGR